MTRQLTATAIHKRYGPRPILRDVHVTAYGGECLGIVGDNGSGKSTLLRVLAGVLTPDAGSLGLKVNGTDVAPELIPQHAGFVAPYLRLYDEFTSTELLHLHARWHGRHVDATHVENILDRVGLTDRADDVIRTFSSGLQQRMSIALAVHLSPDVLILDEPSVTLDRRGRDVLEAEILRARADGVIVILATNDDRERQLCTSIFNVSS
ncbi:MAG: ABC transporter ATP-binding protein [Candidatus Kapabacteria bacterium]|nr:ABC transporter ATP-binding protein [Candidatus Kapabacteria bacterium]